MVLLGSIGTLLFLAALLTALVLLVRAAGQLVRGRRARAVRTLAGLALTLVVYLGLVATVALATPRRERLGGAPVCFDDWCVAAQGRARAPGAAGCPAVARVWLVTLEVSSRAKRVTQREAAAVAEVEDAAGRRYRPCGPALPDHGRVPTLRDPVAPGDSFALTLPFALPAGAAPVGAVVRHPHTPGALILGDDEALFHPPTLLRL